ncbi:MAG: nuclear transport factor 2 family protein [Pseudomonadota bacterium]
MTDSIAGFFDAWCVEDANLRLSEIRGCVTEEVTYADPRTPQPINGVAALDAYVGMFSANAPGWTAKVVRTDTIADVTRVTVAFGGNGPDGTEQIQLGQYFVEKDGDLVSRIVGFVGTGELNRD